VVEGGRLFQLASATREGSAIIKDWPEESHQAAQLVIDTSGEPHEATDALSPGTR
jgi:hypothetical protein